MVRSPRVVMRRLTQRFSPSSQKRCECRFGRKRRRLRLLAWETVFPVFGRLPVTWQTRDMTLTLEQELNCGAAALYTSIGADRQPAQMGLRRPGALPRFPESCYILL